MFFLILATCLSLFAYLAWRRFDVALALLFFSLPTYLIRFKIGPIPSTVLETLLGVIVLVFLIRYAKSAAKRLPSIIREHYDLFIALILFLLGATISIFTAVDLRSALGEWRAFYLEPLILFIILVGFVKTKTTTLQPYNPTTRLILIALTISGLLTSSLAIYQHFTGWLVPYSFWENRNTYRVTAWYGFPNGVGLFLGPLIPLALYLIRQAWAERKKLMNRVVIGMNMLFLMAAPLAIVFAKSTGAIIGVGAGIGTLLLFSKKTRWPALALGVFGLIGLILMPDNAIKREIFMQDYSGQLRQNIWAETAEFLSAHPLAGAGLASYEERIAPYRIDRGIEIFHHPHNLLLTMWVNVGLTGLIGFLLAAVWFYRVAIFGAYDPKTFFRKISHPFVPFLTSAMTVVLVMGLVDSPYIKNDLALLFWLLPALLIVTAEEIKETKKS